MPRFAIVAILLASIITLAGASTPPRPISQPVLDAKTIYIANQTGEDRFSARALQELNTWGRFTIVTDRSKADVTLTISTEHRSNPDSDDERGYITLQLLIPHDDIPQFSYTQDDLVRFMEADITKSLKLLRKRIEDRDKNKAVSAAGAH